MAQLLHEIVEQLTVSGTPTKDDSMPAEDPEDLARPSSDEWDMYEAIRGKAAELAKLFENYKQMRGKLEVAEAQRLTAFNKLDKTAKGIKFVKLTDAIFEVNTNNEGDGS